jgi:predicted CoA-binding protein
METRVNQHIQDFVDFKRVAVVGVSNSLYKYGYRVYHDLKSRGYDVVPVNPKLDTFDGQTAYPSLSAIPETVEGAVIIIPPPRVPDVLREAAEAGIMNIWLQPGAESSEAIALAEELGLNLVHTFCVMVEARRAGRAYV